MRNRRFAWSVALRDLRGDRTMRAEIREERLRATSGLKRPEDLAERLTAWRGRSGRRYVVGVHGSSEPEVADLTDAVVIAVERRQDGTAAVIDVAAPGAASSRRARLRWQSVMRARGATEMHVHLLAEDAAERDAVVRDLAISA